MTKVGREALEQYRALAEALRQIDAGWVVDEVEALANMGRTVRFADLGLSERESHEERFRQESSKGLAVERATRSEQIGVPLEADERLDLLAKAADRVITAAALSNAAVTEFADRYGLRSVVLDQPRSIFVEDEEALLADQAPESPADEGSQADDRQEVRRISREDVDDALDAMHDLLSGRVVE